MPGAFSVILKYLQDTDIVAGLPTIFGKWFTSVLCLLQGPELMLKAYGKVRKTQSRDDLTLTTLNRLPEDLLPYQP